MKIIRGLIAGCCFQLAVYSVPVAAQLSAEEQEQVQNDVTRILAELDASRLSMSDMEYVLRLYLEVKSRPPTLLEAFTVIGLLNGDYEEHPNPDGSIHRCLVQITRSDAFLQLLADEYGLQKGIGYEWLRDNLDELLRFKPLDIRIPGDQPFFSSDPEDFELLSQYTPPKRLNNNPNYSLYFGNVHGHTNLSDGRGTPEDAYREARKHGHDFFATSEHAVLLKLLPWLDGWKKSIEVADAHNEEGKFVTHYVWEWSSWIFGHINVIGTEELTTAIGRPHIASLYDWLWDHPTAIGRFNHPGRLKRWLSEFDSFRKWAKGLQTMAGIEMFNKGKDIRERLYAAGYDNDPDSNHLDEALNNDWDLGVAGGQDDHQAQWGHLHHAVTGVWSESLTRAGIYDAYKNRRTYATEDRNLSLSFRIDGNEMGSRLEVPANSAHVVIELYDEDDQNTSHRVSLYRNGTIMVAKDIFPKPGTVTWWIEPDVDDYYYVVVEAAQPDGDYAITSPIWFQ